MQNTSALASEGVWAYVRICPQSGGPNLDFSPNHARDCLLVRQLDCTSRFSGMHNIHELNRFARINRSSTTAGPKRRATADPKDEQHAYTTASNQEWILCCTRLT